LQTRYILLKNSFCYVLIIIITRKDFAKVSKKLVKYRSEKIILLNHQNNYENSSMMSKKFYSSKLERLI